jgi:hypothetical protein
MLALKLKLVDNSFIRDLPYACISGDKIDAIR